MLSRDEFHIGSNNHRSNSYLLKWVKNSDAQIHIFLPFFAQMSLNDEFNIILKRAPFNSIFAHMG